MTRKGKTQIGVNHANRYNSNTHNTKRQAGIMQVITTRIISSRRKDLGMRQNDRIKSIRIFFEKMVFERAMPFSSTQNVLAQYLRILTELLRQE